MFGLFKKKPKPTPKPLKPVRIAVHCPDGTTVVHYAAYRTLRANGGLSLHDEKGGGQTVADYAPGAWTSVSCGTRKVSA